MTTQSTVTSDPRNVAERLSNEDSLTVLGDGKQPITPTERWMLICENVYARAQKRGFVGGNPLQDLLDAEREVDAAYETDFNCVFSLTSTAEISEQLKSLFAGYGFDQDDLDDLLNGHREGLERLAAMNGELLDSTSAWVVRQTQLLKEVASESVRTLQSLTHGRLGPESVFHVAELSLQAFDNALMGFHGSTNLAAETPSATLLQDALASKYRGHSAAQLLDAPVAALKEISSSLEKSLEEEFGIITIRELAANPQAQWARAVVLLADAAAAGDGASPKVEPSAVLPPVADAPITEAGNLRESQARLLTEGLGIKTVRDLGTHPLFDLARAIVMLAESEGP